MLFPVFTVKNIKNERFGLNPLMFLFQLLRFFCGFKTAKWICINYRCFFVPSKVTYKLLQYLMIN